MNDQQIRQMERFGRKESNTSAKYIRRIKELPGAPETLAPFTDVLSRVYTDLQDVEHPGKKTVGTYCVMAPHELIYAAGAQPVKLCSGNYTSASIGDDVVPRDACPLVKAVAGFGEIGMMPLYENLSLMAVPITCDCKKKIADLLRQYCDVIPMQVPATKEDEDVEQYVAELYSFVHKLEDVTGNKVTYESLAEGIKKVGYAQYELSELVNMRRKYPYLMRGTHLMTIMNASSYMDAGKWADCLHLVNRELRTKIRRKERVTSKALPRILVTGSPIIFPNMKIPLLIEEMGAYLASDETCMGERGMYDPVVPVDQSFDGLMRSLAIRSIRPCSCPTFADNTQRIYRVKQMIQDNQIQGVIYHVLRGCLVYDYEYKLLEEELGKLDIPVIRLESDYNEEDVEQLRVRIEAFIELIKLRLPPEKRRGPYTENNKGAGLSSETTKTMNTEEIL